MKIVFLLINEHSKVKLLLDYLGTIKISWRHLLSWRTANASLFLLILLDIDRKKKDIYLSLKFNFPLLLFPFKMKRIPHIFNAPWNIPVYIQYIAEFTILSFTFTFLHRAFPWQLLVKAQRGRKEPNVAIVDRREQRRMSTWWDTGTYLDITPSCLWVLQLKRRRSCGRGEKRSGKYRYLCNRILGWIEVRK